ncbi:MAG: transposase [Planctomycetota bacterium]
MSRPLRFLPGGMVFHVLNRGVNRRMLFSCPHEYEAFEHDLLETLRTRPMRICSFCLMPNHWHMVLWPQCDGDLSAFVHHLTSLHALRWKRRHDEVGLGPLYQGRFKAFPIQTDYHLNTVVRYVERNPLRANLVTRAENWLWSSLGQSDSGRHVPLSDWPTTGAPLRRCVDWIDWVNTPQTEAEIESLRRCTKRGSPYGEAAWTGDTASALGIDSTLRQAGRPRIQPT